MILLIVRAHNKIYPAFVHQIESLLSYIDSVEFWDMSGDSPYWISSVPINKERRVDWKSIWKEKLSDWCLTNKDKR